MIPSSACPSWQHDIAANAAQEGSGANGAIRSTMLAAEWLRAGNGQAEEHGGIVRGSPLRPRSHHPVRALVSSIQAEPARPGGDDGRARPVDGAYDHNALGAAIRTGVRETLETVCPGSRSFMASRRDIRQDPRGVVLPIPCR